MTKNLSWLLVGLALMATPAAAATVSCFEQGDGQCRCSVCPAPCPSLSGDFQIADNQLYQKLRGQIIIRSQAAGQAYYVDPREPKLRYLGTPDRALEVLQARGQGTSNATLAKLAPGLARLYGPDSDLDGLPDAFERSIGTKPYHFNSDNDRYSDRIELADGYDPLGPGRLKTDARLANRLAGRILLQAEHAGETWYVNPKDGKRYFFSNRYDTLALIEKAGTGVSDYTFERLIDNR